MIGFIKSILSPVIIGGIYEMRFDDDPLIAPIKVQVIDMKKGYIEYRYYYPWGLGPAHSKGKWSFVFSFVKERLYD